MDRTRILLLDDDPNVVTTLAGVLSHEGYFVAPALNISQATHLVDTISFDVAILDLWLVDETSLPLLAHIKSISPQTVVIYLTGYGTVASAVAATHGGAVAFLLKPCEIAELNATIARGLAQRSLPGTRQRHLPVPASMPTEDHSPQTP